MVMMIVSAVQELGCKKNKRKYLHLMAIFIISISRNQSPYLKFKILSSISEVFQR
jgi:hypothetical protein